MCVCESLNVALLPDWETHTNTQWGRGGGWADLCLVPAQSRHEGQHQCTQTPGARVASLVTAKHSKHRQAQHKEGALHHHMFLHQRERESEVKWRGDGMQKCKKTTLSHGFNMTKHDGEYAKTMTNDIQTHGHITNITYTDMLEFNHIQNWLYTLYCTCTFLLPWIKYYLKKHLNHSNSKRIFEKKTACLNGCSFTSRCIASSQNCSLLINLSFFSPLSFLLKLHAQHRSLL